MHSEHPTDSPLHASANSSLAGIGRSVGDAREDAWWLRVATLDDALQHGLKENEFKQITDTLGRSVNVLEIGICSALYSEHCSYKSTKVHLKNLPTEGELVIQGPGENAGIVSIGHGLGVAFKVESHNHPSFIEPFQGAATGVGGILRDVFTMGARPLATLNSLRFGPPTDRYSRYLLKNVVRGIGSYGNCMGIPNIGGEVFFHEKYTKNCLVNAFALGIVEEDKIFLGNASGVGNPVFYVGSKTGRDGIHGATMASEEFDESSAEKRPTVQVGDPLQEKLLLEACLEVMKTGHVVGIQDMGAAGMTSSSFEMAERAGNGVRIHLDRVPMREEGMNPYEIMLSESQERMLLVVSKGAEAEVQAVFARWGLDAVAIGEVIAGKEVELFWHGQLVSALAASVLTSSVPMYRWPESEPSTFQATISFDPMLLEQPEDLSSCLRQMIVSPNLCSRAPLFEQYDSTVRGNTVLGPGGDSGVIRVKVEERSYDIGVAATLDCNSRYCQIDPYLGAALSVVEAYRNIVATGCTPIGISDCLNYGSPEKPEGMWQIAQGIRGIGDSARHLKVPVVSGNVSLYNETQGSPILPTPTIAMVGKIENFRLAVGGCFRAAGDTVLYIGVDRLLSLGGSEYLAQIFQVEKGALPTIDYDSELALAGLIQTLVAKQLISSCHDVGSGGLGVALLESCFSPSGAVSARGPVGVSFRLSDAQNVAREDVRLFGEGGARYVISCAQEKVSQIRKELDSVNIPVLGEGVVIAEPTLQVEGLLTLSTEEAFAGYRQTMRDMLA